MDAELPTEHRLAGVQHGTRLVTPANREERSGKSGDHKPTAINQRSNNTRNLSIVRVPDVRENNKKQKKTNLAPSHLRTYRTCFAKKNTNTNTNAKQHAQAANHTLVRACVQTYLFRCHSALPVQKTTESAWFQTAPASLPLLSSSCQNRSINRSMGGR